MIWTLSMLSVVLIALLILAIVGSPLRPATVPRRPGRDGQYYLTLVDLVLGALLYVILLVMFVTPMYEWFTRWYLDAVSRWLAFA